MTAIPWADPERLGRLTLPQLLCLTHEKPPGGADVCRTFAEYQAAMRRKARDAAAWNE